MDGITGAASAFVEWLGSLEPALVLLFTGLSTAVEMTFLLGLLVPGEAVVMLAASLPTGPAGIALAVAVGTFGGMLGQVAGYLVGRALGPRLQRSRLGRRIGPERWSRAEAYLRERGAPALVAVRFLAVIHAVVPLVAGSVRMPFARFLAWSTLGTALWVGAFVGLGAVSASADPAGGAGLVLTAVGATCLGLIPFTGRAVRRLHRGGARRAAVPAVPTEPLEPTGSPLLAEPVRPAGSVLPTEPVRPTAAGVLALRIGAPAAADPPVPVLLVPAPAPLRCPVPVACPVS